MGGGNPPEGNCFVLGAGSVWRFQKLSGPSHARRCTHARRFVAIEMAPPHLQACDRQAGAQPPRNAWKLHGGSKPLNKLAGFGSSHPPKLSVGGSHIPYKLPGFRGSHSLSPPGWELPLPKAPSWGLPPHVWGLPPHKPPGLGGSRPLSPSGLGAPTP